MSVADVFVAVGGTLGGLATAVGTGYLVAGSIRKRRLERSKDADSNTEDEQEWLTWRVDTQETLEGVDPTWVRPGFYGVVNRLNRLEDHVFGNHNNTIEPTGRSKK